MATNQIKISLSELRSSCNATIKTLQRYIECGKTPEEAYAACSNQLMGMSCLIMGSIGEATVKDAFTALKVEYMRIQHTKAEAIKD
ncbi:hypothetical protein EVC37_21755 [Methylocaldum sp. BRCS4]|uniref:hypothetical protein n=1 Tax=Methylocaldum sp. GT1BW TaxID=3438964 RepID=UPI0012EB4D96|nr:hypothetical protein [Methylocaldum sp. BRCS4]